MTYHIDLATPQDAIFSNDGKYRYILWRSWSKIKPPLLFIGLNPSRAGRRFNDATVRRLIARASKAEFGKLIVANLYGLISVNPDLLLEDNQAVGIETDLYLADAIHLVEEELGLVLCGWGSFPAVRKRSEIVLKMIPAPYCLGTNKDGQPKHPLYVAYDVPMVRLPA